MLQYALELYDAGIVTIPISLPDKNPVFGFKWGDWYETMPTREVFMARWQEKGQRCDGLAVVCGAVELLDTDTKNDPKRNIHLRVYQALKDNLDEATFARLFIQETRNGGYHFWYKVQPGEEHGNIPDLARIEYTPDDRFALDLPPERGNIGVLCETRGYGGYGAIAPTPGYRIIQGDIRTLPVLTKEEHETVLLAAQSFNEYEEPEMVLPNYTPSALAGTRPGDVYNHQTKPDDLLSLMERYGWRRLRQIGNSLYLGRPGAKHAHKHDGKINTHRNCFVNYSSSVADFVPMKGYSPFYVYTYLVHRGDIKEATKDLASRGYEDESRRAKPPQGSNNKAQRPFSTNGAEPPVDPFAAIADEDVLSEFEKFKFSIKKRPDIRYNLFFTTQTHPKRKQPVAFPGALVAIYGKAKARKTTVLGLIIASALSRRPVLNVDYQEDGKILWIDTEQGNLFFWETMWRVYVQSGVKEDPDRLFSYSLVDMDPPERMMAVDRLMHVLRPRILVLDGIIDFMFDMNDVTETGKVIQQLRRWTSMGCTVFPVLHLNKGKSQEARGHIGTFLTNKCDTAIEARGNQDDDKKVSICNTWSRGPRFKTFDLYAGQDGVLYLDNMPPYDFTLAKPERVLQSTLTDDDGEVEEMEIISSAGHNFADDGEDIPF